jgi:hypothetical protein
LEITDFVASAGEKEKDGCRGVPAKFAQPEDSENPLQILQTVKKT